ncbi:MAG TPA: hypothetical protein VG478_11910 [Acidimicrobiales bacterium]|jgi:protein-S-isoprenylcysteine O-methyltransferase Ste14|nr:hypothetical protein [Acidimicrobiales bacterium]
MTDPAGASAAPHPAAAVDSDIPAGTTEGGGPTRPADSTIAAGTTPTQTASHADVWKPVVTAAKVLVPSTLLASLFFYFGLRYTHDHYLQYGLDDAGLGFSNTDYIVRSLNVTIQPARLVAFAAIIGVAFHVGVCVVLRALAHRRQDADRRFARILGAALVVLGVAGILVFWSPGRLGTRPVTSTAWWLVSVLVVIYGAYLGWIRYRPEDRASRYVSDALHEREGKVLAAVLLGMAVVLVAYGAFEFTRAYARERALQQALRNERTPWAFPLVRVYSRVDLALEDLGVAEERLQGGEDEYVFRYVGLRLFLHDNDRLVLWPSQRSPRFGMFILRETDDVRVEYQPELR